MSAAAPLAASGEVDLSDGKATPDALASLDAGTTSLLLFGNSLGAVPPVVFTLTSLLELALDGNGISVLAPTISSLKSLQSLALHDNLLTELPEEIGALSALRELRLDRNQLTKLPSTIGKLPLETLHLDGNRLTELPDTIGDVTTLLDLGIGSNPPLKRLPATLSRCTSLMIVWYSDDALASGYENVPAEVLAAGDTEVLREHLAKQLPAAADGEAGEAGAAAASGGADAASTAGASSSSTAAAVASSTGSA